MSYHLLRLLRISLPRQGNEREELFRSLHSHFSWITIKVVFRCVILSLISFIFRRQWKSMYEKSGPGNFSSPRVFVVAPDEMENLRRKPHESHRLPDLSLSGSSAPRRKTNWLSMQKSLEQDQKKLFCLPPWRRARDQKETRKKMMKRRNEAVTQFSQHSINNRRNPNEKDVEETEKAVKLNFGSCRLHFPFFFFFLSPPHSTVIDLPPSTTLAFEMWKEGKATRKEKMWNVESIVIFSPSSRVSFFKATTGGARGDKNRLRKTLSPILAHCFCLFFVAPSQERSWKNQKEEKKPENVSRANKLSSLSSFAVVLIETVQINEMKEKLGIGWSSRGEEKASGERNCFYLRARYWFF